VTGVAAGSCTIAANQAGNANYGAAAQQTQIFSIGSTAGRYSKIANNGSTLSDSAVLGSGPGDWACTRDNQTGLTWEIKTTDGGLRDTSKLFRNYDDVGVAQKGVGQFPTQADILAASNSIGFAKAVNASALCSYDQWRLPSSDELGSLIDSYYSPMINPSHFPNTLANSYMWTSTAHSTDPAKGWVLYFNDGVSYLGERKNSYYVRLVRTSQALATHELAIATSGTGSGTVASDVSGINCSASAGAASGTCVAAFSRGSTVTLIATAASGSTFSGWSGDCTGTEACTVTLNGPRKLTASFRQRPFVATTNSVITPTSATISTRIAFNPGDVGKQGFVFVTAWMPFSGLGSLALSNARSGDPSVTSTLDAPYAGERHAELQVAQTSLSKTESSSYVLVQLTASGWQLVVNGQLIPYASGVLGDLLAAQTLLTNANPSALQGTQFCLGYGTSAEEMIASGRMLPVASISDPNPTGSTSTGSCNVAASTPASTYTGLWWNQNESGWGVSVTQRDSTAVVAWYTYDSGAQPSWFIISSCMMAGAGCTGDLYSVTGGTRLGTPWNGSGKTVSKVGSGTFAFSDNNTGTLNYTVNGAGGSKALTRLVYAEGSSKPAIDYSSLWWNESESGWGITITQQYGMIVAVIYTYDTVGKPTWYIASSCPIMETRCFGDLYQVTGGKAPVVPWSGANPAVKKVGSVNFEFNDSNVGTIKYTINGVAGTKAITRLLF
jgi:hypothetical protein